MWEDFIGNGTEWKVGLQGTWYGTTPVHGSVQHAVVNTGTPYLLFPAANYALVEAGILVTNPECTSTWKGHLACMDC